MSTVAATILLISKQFAIYTYFFILIGGLIGNFCNVLVFTYVKVFRHHQCAFYLVVGSIIDYGLLLTGLPFRLTELAFSYDTTRQSVIWCKLRPMMNHTMALISFSIICFAAIDQYLSTNHQHRLKQMSTLKLAYRLVFSSIIIWTFYDCIFFYYFDLRATSGCTISDPGFSIYYSFGHYITLNGIIPLCVSSLFSILAYLNVRRIVQLRIPIFRRKLDKQLTALVLAKVVFVVVTISPSIIFRIYILNVTVSPTDFNRIAIHQFLSNIAFALFYINSAVRWRFFCYCNIK